MFLHPTHAVLCGPAPDRLRDADIKEVIVTNSLPLGERQRMENMKIVSVAPMLGEAIRRIHRNESVSGLFD